MIQNHGNYKHGRKGTPEYNSWSLMRDRCNNPNNKSYKYYGGRGIKVCKRWDDFSNFFDDMGIKPSRDFSLDRVDNSKNYNPSNCRWTDKHTQSNNKRSNTPLTFKGRTLNIGQWAKLLGLSPATLSYRVCAGWTVERTLTVGVSL